MSNSCQASEDELLSAQGVWEDYLSLKQTSADRRGRAPFAVLPISHDAVALVRELIRADMCQKRN